ncbi:MAG: hypothetical protein M3O15_16435 [Acidobacteriota bacterium]|nr:hypothetical protein [Acidobacteriota bacterium]
MSKLARAGVCLMACVLAAPCLRATTAVERSNADMTQEAALIVIGQCSDTHSAWVGRGLVTVASIAVGEVLKGHPATRITVVLPGGIDSNRPVPIATTWPAAPHIESGEKVLLFLVPQSLIPGSFSVVGFAQGKFGIMADRQGQLLAMRDLSALELASPSGSHPGRAGTVPLRALRQEVLDVLAPGPRQ